MGALYVSIVWVALLAWALDRILKHLGKTAPVVVDLGPINAVVDDTVRRMQSLEDRMDVLVVLAEDTKRLADESKKLNSKQTSPWVLKTSGNGSSPMELKHLVAEAMEKSPEFKAKYEWRVVTRNRAPELKWLMPLLEEALGADYVMSAARTQLAEKEKAENDGKNESEGLYPEDAWTRSEADEINPS